MADSNEAYVRQNTTKQSSNSSAANTTSSYSSTQYSKTNDWVEYFEDNLFNQEETSSTYEKLQQAADDFVERSRNAPGFWESIVSAGSAFTEDVSNFFHDSKEMLQDTYATVVDGVSSFCEDPSKVLGDGIQFVQSELEDVQAAAIGTWNNMVESLSSAGQDLYDSMPSNVQSIMDVPIGWVDSFQNLTKDTMDNLADTWIGEAAKSLKNMIQSVGATAGYFRCSITEGAYQFAETLVDSQAFGAAIFYSIPAAIMDTGQAIYGKITGNEWDSMLFKNWENYKNFVSSDIATGIFDTFYNDTDIGNDLQENALFEKQVRKTGNTVGKEVLKFLLTKELASTGTTSANNIFSMSPMTCLNTIMTATDSTESTFQSGGDFLDGLVAGCESGIWSGIQSFLGGQIKKVNLFSTDNPSFQPVMNLFNDVSRSVLSGADSALDSVVKPALKLTYTDGYKDANGNYVEFTDEDSILDRFKALYGGFESTTTKATQSSFKSFVKTIVSNIKKSRSNSAS